MVNCASPGDTAWQRHLTSLLMPQEPEEDGYELLYPFVVCKSNGGPFDDEAFCAGFRAGEISQMLAAGRHLHATEIHVPAVATEITGQLDLIALHHGYLMDKPEISGQWPQWCDVTFRRNEIQMELE